jgi:hypothetical protein
MLGAWMLQRQRNDCMFNGASPNLSTIVSLSNDEAQLWSMARDKGISLLTGHVVTKFPERWERGTGMTNRKRVTKTWNERGVHCLASSIRHWERVPNIFGTMSGNDVFGTRNRAH